MRSSVVRKGMVAAFVMGDAKAAHLCHDQGVPQVASWRLVHLVIHILLHALREA